VAATRPVAAAACALVVAAALAAGCATDEPGSHEPSAREPAAREPSAREPAARERSAPEGAAPPASRKGTAPPPSRDRDASPAPLPRASCPPAASNCRTASGRVVYVERVDPDGDGDAHFVLASRDSITGPGISVIDVKRSLRPSPLPGRGDRISAAGPVYRGSYGQRQIEATELHVAR
jgi:hypothetical protein